MPRLQYLIVLTPSCDIRSPWSLQVLRSSIAEIPKPAHEFSLFKVSAMRERLNLAWRLKILSFQADHIGSERLIRLGVDIDVTDTDLPCPMIQHLPKRDRDHLSPLDGHHGLRLTIQQKTGGPIAKTATILDIQCAGWSAAEFTAKSLGDDCDIDASPPKAFSHSFFQYSSDR